MEIRTQASMHASAYTYQLGYAWNKEHSESNKVSDHNCFYSMTVSLTNSSFMWSRKFSYGM
jgi:hypothetical protein